MIINRFKTFFSLFLYLVFSFESIPATYLVATKEANREIYRMLMIGDKPREIFSTEPGNLLNRLKKIDPDITIHWIPPAIWQLVAIDAYFHDPEVRSFVNMIGYTQGLFDPKEREAYITHPQRNTWPNNFDERIIKALITAENLQDIVRIYDDWIDYPGLSTCFFRINNRALSLLKKKTFTEVVNSIIKKLPPFEEWQENFHFPFLYCPYDDGKPHVTCLYHSLKDEPLLLKIIAIEMQAHDEKKNVFYRGYPSCVGTFPDPIHQHTNEPHALSFGSSLLGGLFFSTDGCALRYATSDSLLSQTFFAVKISEEEVVGEKSCFRIGPLHPYLQLLSDGEFAHSHTKVVANSSKDNMYRSIPGYFAECNRNIFDPVGFVVTHQYTVDELADRLNTLFVQEGEFLQK